MPGFLICENPECGKRFFRRRYKVSKHSYCSHSCAVTVNNKTHPRNPGIVKICAHCSKEFKGREKYCSRKCKDLGESISGKELLSLINEFVKKNNRIPYKKEFTHHHAARLRFGTWNNAVRTAGFDPNPVRFANRHVAKDGHKCDSFAEKIIDDWLYARGIKHKRNFPYPGNKGFTCDFIIGNKWIEFFGLSGELRRYDNLMRRKLNLVRKYNLDLIRIYPKDLIPIRKLKEKFSFL